MQHLLRVGGRQPYTRPQQFAPPPHHHQQQPVYGGEYQVMAHAVSCFIVASHLQDEQYEDGEEQEVRGTQV